MFYSPEEEVMYTTDIVLYIILKIENKLREHITHIIHIGSTEST